MSATADYRYIEYRIGEIEQEAREILSGSPLALGYLQSVLEEVTVLIGGFADEWAGVNVTKPQVSATNACPRGHGTATNISTELLLHFVRTWEHDMAQHGDSDLCIYCYRSANLELDARENDDEPF